MSKPDTAPPRQVQRWTTIDAYLGGLARRGKLRRSRRVRQRSEPEAPTLLLSTIPFAALIAVLGMLVIAFAVAAWPAAQPEFRPEPAAKELGTAPRGWFEQAKKEMREDAPQTSSR